MQPSVSVVIPFYNDPYVQEAIDSVLAQTCPPSEIIVVDDGSTRHSDKIMPAYAGLVRYVSQANGGTASALNTGIRLSTGDYIAWLSSDDRFEANKLERQLAFMQRSGAIASCTAFSVMNGAGDIIDAHYGPAYADGTELMRMLAHTNPINGCTMMLRRDVFAIVGLFNESLRYTQDYDYWARIVLSGLRIEYVPEPLTRYRMHEAMGTVVQRPALMAEYDGLRAFYGSRIAQLFAGGVMGGTNG